MSPALQQSSFAIASHIGSRVEVYVPRPFLVPEDSITRRNLRKTRPDVQGNEPFSDQELRAYDDRTVLYDVALTYDNRRLVAIAPPFLNLANEYLPIQVRISGDRQLEGQVFLAAIVPGKRSVTVFLSPRVRRPVAAPLAVEITFANGLTHTLQVRPNATSGVRYALAALQKDNRPEWIRRWVRHYSRIGIQRVILYDNGSSNLEDVLSALRSMPEEVHVVVVAWPYPYGPARGHENKFTQAGALNHARLCLANSKWLANFDIDEYLVPPGWRLSIALRRIAPWKALIRFRFYWFRHVAPPSPDVIVSPDNQIVREKRLAEGGKWKYIGRTKSLRDCNIHAADVPRWRIRNERPERAVFFHYIGITTNWKKRHWDRSKTDAVDPADERYTEDTRLRDFHVREAIR